ncbi:MAG: ABC transporter permease [Bdellovibrio sp.]|nr:ABC transporter permease [Bdellovibrio sp.]
MAGMAVFAPQVTHYSFEEQNISEKLEPPSAKHWMGTDTLGRDLYSRVVYGARLSLLVGFVTAISGLLLGVSVGAIAGYRGGAIDLLLMNLVDFLMIFPSVLMAILLMLLFGRGPLGIILAISITSWLSLARQVRGQVMQAKRFPYVESARAIGASPAAILFKHILPNLLGPILVSLTIQIPNNIMAESLLSFVGLGLAPPYSSWGTLANEGFRGMQTYPHLLIFPSAAIFITILAFNYLGDELRKKSEKRL